MGCGYLLCGRQIPLGDGSVVVSVGFDCGVDGMNLPICLRLMLDATPYIGLS